MRTVAVTPRDIPLGNTFVAPDQSRRIPVYACQQGKKRPSQSVCGAVARGMFAKAGRDTLAAPDRLLWRFPSSSIPARAEGTVHPAEATPRVNFVHASFVGVVALGCLLGEITFGLILRSIRRSPLDNLPRPGRGALIPNASHTVDGREF